MAGQLPGSAEMAAEGPLHCCSALCCLHDERLGAAASASMITIDLRGSGAGSWAPAAEGGGSWTLLPFRRRCVRRSAGLLPPFEHLDDDHASATRRSRPYQPTAFAPHRQCKYLLVLPAAAARWLPTNKAPATLHRWRKALRPAPRGGVSSRNHERFSASQSLHECECHQCRLFPVSASAVPVAHCWGG